MGRQPEEETDLHSLLGPPPLLEGEDASAYHTLKFRILSAVQPEDAIEEMWVRDIVDLLWETARLRRFKTKLMSVAAHQGLKSLLRHRIAFESSEHLAQGWARRDPAIVKDVKQNLRSVGLDEEAIAAQTLADQRDMFEKIDRMIMQTEARRHVVLREIDRRRDALARRLREISTEVEDGEFTEIAPPHREAAE
jgi:hypothetical protein